MEGQWDLLGIAALFISNVGMWIREWRKAQSFKKSNGWRENFDQKLDATVAGVAKLEAHWEDQQRHCDATVKTLASEIRNNREKLYEIKHDKT